MKFILALVVASLAGVAAFSPCHVLSSKAGGVKPVNKPLSLHAVDPSVMEGASMLVSILKRVPDSEAKGAFFFFFFAGSGALGIGGAQIPKLLAEYVIVCVCYSQSFPLTNPSNQPV